MIAGSYVTHGNIQRNSLARLVRDGAIVYTGRIGSLRRFKDDVREVAEGFECGIGLENFQDIHEGDVIETYEVREVARTLGYGRGGGSGAGMFVALCRFDLRVPGCTSLKEKRHVVKTLTASLRGRSTLRWRRSITRSCGSERPSAFRPWPARRTS